MLQGSQARVEVPQAPALGCPYTCPCHVAWTQQHRGLPLSLSALSGFGLPPRGTSREQRWCCMYLTPGKEEGCCPELWLSTGQETT